MLHVDIIMLHDDRSKSLVKIVMLHVNLIHLACRRSNCKNKTFVWRLQTLRLFRIFIVPHLLLWYYPRGRPRDKPTECPLTTCKRCWDYYPDPTWTAYKKGCTILFNHIIYWMHMKMKKQNTDMKECTNKFSTHLMNSYFI